MAALRLLIIGGTRFLGRHLAAQALQRGHHLTLLHRGRSGPGLFPEAEHRIADRDGDLAALDAPAGGGWDSVIDTSAYLPRQVRSLARVLRGRVGQYQLVSSISVYADPPAGGAPLREDHPLLRLADPATEEVTAASYGGLKALCEQAAGDPALGFGQRALLLRPGLLVGPHDPTGRFTWWVRRLQRGGEVLAPGDPAAPLQFIDARDAAAFMLDLAEAGAPQPQGPSCFNLSGPAAAALTMGGFLTQAAAGLNPAHRLHWVDEGFLLAQGVAPWSELPLWVPAAGAGMMRADLGRAVHAGLSCRPLAQTLRDTAAWAASVDAAAAASTSAPATEGPPRPAVGLAPEREAALLQAWAARPARG